MKTRLSILGLVLVLGALIVSSCGPVTSEPVEPPTGEPRPVVHSTELREGEAYTIALEIDPSSDRQWDVEFSEAHLELVDRTVDEAAGEEVFTLRARAQGVTEAYFSYSRHHEVICNFNIGSDLALAEAMTEAQVREIAANSECGEAGALLENAFYNDWTATWWIDLDVEREGCSPACVVDVRTRQAEINWRCTGALPPAEEAPEETTEPPAPTPLPTATPVPPPTETPAPAAGEPAVCWYGRVDSTPADAAIDDYLVLLPEEARRAVDVVGIDEAVESQIVALRDTGTYAHFWGMLNCDVPGWGGCQLSVTRLRPEGPEGPFFDPDPIEGWTGAIFGTPADAQFDDYFVLSGGVPMRYGIDSADPAIAAQLESLRDTGSIVRVWGQVTCPTIDFQGTQIQVEWIEVVVDASAREGYEGWKPYTSVRFGYTVWYPAECTVMGANLDDAVQFAGREWPVLSVSHYDSDFYHPSAGTDLQQWIVGHGMSYDQIDTEIEIAGLPAVHLRHDQGQGSYASDEYYLVRDGQLFRIMLLHAGGKEDWDLYDKFLRGFTFP